MDMDVETHEAEEECGEPVAKEAVVPAVNKGKQRAIDPEPDSPPPPQNRRRHTQKNRQHVYTLRPILTIQRSQGFVWNQVRLPLP
jgi:hypothetical protein